MVMKTTDRPTGFDHSVYVRLLHNNPDKAKLYKDLCREEQQKSQESNIQKEPVIETKAEPVVEQTEFSRKEKLIELRKILKDKKIKFFPGSNYDQLLSLARKNNVF